MDLRDPALKKLTQAEFDRLPDGTSVMAQVSGLLACRLVVRVRPDIAQGGDGGRILCIPPEHPLASCFVDAWQYAPPDVMGTGEGEFLVHLPGVG